MLGQQNASNCLAKALYDNVAESPDELAFRKGDILTVLEQNPGGLEGWWLCSLRGRQGIVPGNRLRLLPGMYDPTGLGQAADDGSHAVRRSWASNPNKVVTPQKIGAVYLYDVPPGTKQNDKGELKSSSPIPRYMVQGSVAGSYDTPPSSKLIGGGEAYDEPRPNPCRSPLPASSVYDSPKSNASRIHNNTPDQLLHDYDVDQTMTYDVPRGSDNNAPTHIITISDESYDVPPSSSNYKALYDGRAFSRSSNDTSGSSSSFRSPSGSHSSIETLSLSSVGGSGSSNRSSLEQHPNEVYDIPPEPLRVIIDKQETYDVPMNNMPAKQQMKEAVVSSDSVYDIPPQAIRDCSPVVKTSVVDSIVSIAAANDKLPVEEKPQSGVVPESAELLLDRDSAVELLEKHQQEVQASISKLFSFVSTTWRKFENMDSKIVEIESTCRRLHSSLTDLYDFAQGALANSTHSADKSLSFKLNKLVSPIKESCSTVKTCIAALDEKNWSASHLAYSEESHAPDELDMLVACARNLVEDVRQVTSLIQGNSNLLFKSQQTLSDKPNKPPVAPKPNLKTKPPPSCAKPKVQERPLPPTPANSLKTQVSTGDYFNEYDYVNLESKESVERENESIKAAMPKDMCQSFDELVKQSEVPVLSHSENNNTDPSKEVTLDAKDLQILCFYRTQIETHISHLTQAIDAFLSTIKNNQPPKVFVGHSKFIIIGAHKLVYIGDSVHRNLVSPDLKTRVMQHANGLCESLKTLVVATKKAAAEFPSVVAVQEMVDSVVDVSLLSNNLKLAIMQGCKS